MFKSTRVSSSASSSEDQVTAATIETSKDPVIKASRSEEKFYIIKEVSSVRHKDLLHYDVLTRPSADAINRKYVPTRTSFICIAWHSYRDKGRRQKAMQAFAWKGV